MTMTNLTVEREGANPLVTRNSLFHSAEWRHAVEDAFDLRIDEFRPAAEPGASAYYSVVRDIRGVRVVATPFSDYCEPDIHTETGWAEFADHLRSFDAPVTLRPFANDVALADPTFERSGGVLWHGVDLSGGADQAFDRVKSKVRTKIRRVPKLGVRFRVSSDPADIALMHQMHVELRKGKYSMLAQPKRFFDALAANFGDKMVVAFAEIDGSPIAGMTFFEWNQVWYYKFSASYPNEVRPNPALMMHAIRLGAERGLQLVDMGRSDADQPGLLAFKEQFEPQVRELSVLRWAPDGYANERGDEVGATLGRLTEILTHPDVPTSAATAAGDLLYRYFT